MAALRARLLEFLVERTGEGALTSYVRAQVIQTIVVIAKRAWLEDQVPLRSCPGTRTPTAAPHAHSRPARW